MSRERAIEICKNLEITLNKITDRPLRYDDTIFEKPSVGRSKLKKMRDKLIAKHNLTKKDLK